MEPTAEPAGLRLLVNFWREAHSPSLAGLDPAAFDTVATEPSRDRVPAHLVFEMMNLMAAATGDLEFGMRYAESVDLRRLGAICLLWECSENLAVAMRMNEQYLQVVNGSVLMAIEEEDDETVMVYNFLPVTKNGMRQFVEALMVSAVRMIRLGLGDQWSPARIEFPHSPGGTRQVARRVFRAPLQYDSDRCALVVSKEDLQRPFKNRNAEIIQLVEIHLRKLKEEQNRDFCLKVEHLIIQCLPRGRPTLPDIANLLSMSPRSLQRRLADKGLHFNKVVENARRIRVRQFYSEEHNPRLDRLASLLGFSDASATSRFLSQKCQTGSLILRREISAQNQLDSHGNDPSS